MAEIWDLVDKDGHPTGVKWPRADHANIPEGMYHPCTEVWVRVGDRLLIAQRHPEKSEGMKYDAPGGAVLSGEDWLSAAARELYEEVGIACDTERLEYLGAVISRVGYALTYLLRLDETPELKLQPTEVVGYKMVTRDELDGMIDELCRNCAKRYLIYRDRLFE